MTVVLPSGESVSGTLIALNDFDIALRDTSGRYRSYSRAALFGLSAWHLSKKLLCSSFSREATSLVRVRGLELDSILLCDGTTGLRDMTAP